MHEAEHAYRGGDRELVRRGGRGRRHGRHGDRVRARPSGARTLLVDRADPGRATDAGAGILSPETAKRDDPGWVDLVRAAGRHYERLVPAARRRQRMVALRHPPARHPRHRRLGVGVGRGAGVGGVGDQRRRRARDGAGARADRTGAAPSRRRPGRRPDDVRRTGASRGRATAWRCASHRSTRCAVVVPAPLVWSIDGDVRRRGRSRDRGRRVDASTSASSWACSYPSVRCADRSRTCVVPEHDTARLADRATGVRALHGPVGRSSRRGRRDGGRRGLRARRHRGRCARDHARGAASDARSRGRDGARGAGRAAAGERRRPPGARRAARASPNVYVATGHGANGLLLGPVSGAAVADLVLGRSLTLDLDLTPFSPARFQNDSR